MNESRLPSWLLDDPRVRLRNGRPARLEATAVIYWMQRAQRGRDNPALDAAVALANEYRRPLFVHLGHVPFYPRANLRHYAFLLAGLEEVARDVERRGAAFCHRPWGRHRIDEFCREVGAVAVIGDENPLRVTERWRKLAAERLDVALVTVDADVVVPSSCFEKEEYAARTIRPKIARLLPSFLEEQPAERAKVKVRVPAAELPFSAPLDAAAVLDALPIDRSTAPVAPRFFRGGPRAGERRLRAFLEHGLERYPEVRNRPDVQDGTSRLSPWLHFGHLGPRAVARAVLATAVHRPAQDAFLEQCIVRRELAVNYAWRNPDHDRFAGLHDWAKQTLAKHGRDRREARYGEEQLDLARTGDRLWNAAQLEMRVTGHMHGWLRMYWAKRLLAWRRDPEEAFDLAVRLNDRYELDGRDPNGYTGVAWAIGGKHDRPFPPDKPILGLIRPLSAKGAARKFDVAAYVTRVERLAREAGDEGGTDR